MMDHDTVLDFQRIVVTDDESLDTHNNIITQLELERRLPEGRSTCEQLLENVGLKPAREGEVRNRTCNQFVYQGQCLVLGDSGVGKTSLVKSLTGKPFDLEQPKTQGIEHSLVDRKWQNLDLKELIFGNFSRFFKELLIQLTVFGKDGNVIVQESTNLLGINVINPFRQEGIPGVWVVLGLLVTFISGNAYFEKGPKIIPMYLGLIALFATMWCICHSQRFRLIITTCIFFINYHGLMIGVFLSVNMWQGCFSSSFSGISIESRNIHALLFIATVGLIVIKVVHLLTESGSFDIDRKCPHPGQLKFKNQRPVEIFIIVRLLISVIIGFICFTLTAFTKSNVNERNNLIMVVIFFSLVLLVSQSRIVKSLPGWRHKAISIIAIIFFYFVGVIFLSADVYFAITDLMFFCDTIYKEYFCVTSAIGNSNKFTAVCIEKAVINYKELRNALNQKFSSLKLKILDFAGDNEYHAYHHMFLRSQAIYIIVFNMAEFAENSFKDINTRIKTLHLWFESVCSHVPRKTPIFLVGTHRGHMDQICMETLNDHLKKTLWDLYCDELIMNDVDNFIFFPVENSDGKKDTGVQTLQKKIMFVEEELKETIGHDIPLTWIQLQDEIIKLQEKKEAKFCVTLEEFPRTFDYLICTNWSEETLKYFHEKGLVIYLDKDKELSKWVLLKPEILVDIIIQLVTKQPEEIHQRGFRGDWMLLHAKGMLTKSLLERILSEAVQENKEAITAFLEEYDLICPLAYNILLHSSENGEDLLPAHFVPSMLPTHESADKSAPLWLDETKDKKFYVFFKKFLPEPLFHCLLSRAHKNSKVEFLRSQPDVFRDVGKFWLSPWQPYRLKLIKDTRMIEVTFSCSNRNGMKPSDVLMQVFSMVDGICKRNFPFVKFHCGPACPSHVCPGHIKDEDAFMVHPVDEPSDTRPHVYNIMPARQGENIIPFLYCVNHSFEDKLQEWIP